MSDGLLGLVGTGGTLRGGSTGLGGPEADLAVKLSPVPAGAGVSF